MHNRGSVLRFVTICLICFALLIYSFYGLLFETPPTSAAVFSKSEGLNNTISKSESTQSNTDISDAESSTINMSSTDESVPASASGTVKGKILSRYFSPYSASTSYNNTYLKNNTDLNIDIKNLLSSELGFKISKNDEPQVLILHTHTTESFMQEDTDYYNEDYTSRSTDDEKNMVRIGNIVADKLNTAGIKTIHEIKKHDYPEFNGCYSRAAETISSYIKKYPTIKVIMDLHRDAIESSEGEKTKAVTEINGKKAAQIMLVMGSQSGNVTNFPNWQENLKFALRMQQTFEVMYPTLARPLCLNSKNYNESFTTGSVLIEFGTDANTIDEACYSAEMAGTAISSLLNSLQ